MKTFPEKPVVIGAGPAGLCTGWNLATDGIDVTILEKTDKIGGLALSFKDGDYIFDLGPHNFHTVHKDILAFVKKILKSDLQKYNPKIKIFFMNRFLDYPLKGIKVFTVLPLKTMLPAFISFLFARLRLLLFDPEDGDSFESWIKNRFGNTLYGIYFGPYVQKAWKVDASKISKYVAEKRVPPLSISDYIRRLLHKSPKNFHSEDAGFIQHYYPKKGIGELTDWLHDNFVKNNGKIERNVEILSINGKNHNVESITYRQNGKLQTLETDMLFSSIPINELIKTLKMDVPQAVLEAAGRLDYVSEVLLFLKVKKRKIFDSTWTYFSSPEIRFNRIYDIEAFSEYCVPTGKTAYCIEFTCNEEDDIWNSSAEELYSYVMNIFEKHNIMSRSEVEGYFIKKISHAYPRFKIGFEKKLQEILDYLSTVKNLITLGRQGLFCYANVDDALYMGFRAVEILNTIRKKSIDYSDLFPKYTHY